LYVSSVFIGVFVRYLAPVMGEGLKNQTLNPEVRVNVLERNAVVDRAVMKLRQTSVQLRNAFHGHELWFVDSDGKPIVLFTCEL